MRFTKFPLPPSINKCLRPKKETGRLVKTKEAQIWEKQVILWTLKNQRLLHDARLLFLGDKPLRINLTFVFLKSRIITKDGVIKKGRNDAGNFEKSTCDAMAKILGIDDAFFNDRFIKRATCENESQQQVIIEIHETSIFTIDDILNGVDSPSKLS